MSIKAAEQDEKNKNEDGVPVVDLTTTVWGDLFCGRSEGKNTEKADNGGLACKDSEGSKNYQGCLCGIFPLRICGSETCFTVTMKAGYLGLRNSCDQWETNITNEKSSGKYVPRVSKHTEAVVQKGPSLHLKLAAELENLSLLCGSGLAASKLWDWRSHAEKLRAGTMRKCDRTQRDQDWHHAQVWQNPERDQERHHEQVWQNPERPGEVVGGDSKILEMPGSWDVYQG